MTEPAALEISILVPSTSSVVPIVIVVTAVEVLLGVVIVVVVLVVLAKRVVLILLVLVLLVFGAFLLLVAFICDVRVLELIELAQPVRVRDLEEFLLGLRRFAGLEGLERRVELFGEEALDCPSRVLGLAHIPSALPVPSSPHASLTIRPHIQPWNLPPLLLVLLRERRHALERIECRRRCRRRQRR